MKGARLVPRARSAAEAIAIPLASLLAALVLFGVFVSFAGANPLEAIYLMYKGGFGSSFALQNSIVRASPLLLAALCTAMPARVGLVIIGGEGALVLGGLAAAVTPHFLGNVAPGLPPMVMLPAMAASGMVVGGLWITIAGALRYYRGVNETISSLLMVYIAIALFRNFVEGPWRYIPENMSDANKFTTWPIGPAYRIGYIPGTAVHWGAVIGVLTCVLAWVFIQHTTTGFAARIAGGNLRAARVAGLPVGKLILLVCFLGGAAAGLAGMIQVAAIDGDGFATESGLVAYYGYTGILVAFMARQNPLAVIVVSILLGGVAESGGLLQRELGLPDAAFKVFQGILFVTILAGDSYYGRLRIFRPAEPPSPPAGGAEPAPPVLTDAPLAAPQEVAHV